MAHFHVGVPGIELISVFGLAGVGTRASMLGDVCVLTIKKMILVSLSLRVLGSFDQYNVLETLWNSANVTNIGTFAQSTSQEVYWSHLESCDTLTTLMQVY